MNKSTKHAFLAFTLTAISTPYAMADHNSIWGEGWANMPNDIHNTRLDTMDGDNEEFLDFVRMGAGADSVNRYAEDGSTESGSGTGSAFQNGVGSGAMGSSSTSDMRGTRGGRS
ncbi:MAG: hypothetical protein OI74_13655 [Gammaproteobacteria bacterium (ex Lamellibrachia satsuma)]|nr:MAG: hypothetical protein HPY30_16535 [Gammaproteobacteria bacterium (ex Lamellibrachia satsuma)]RRS31672.1 MAG: hypothetical protein OI74_13655 [Gammaproteobacteria bacterium (ex Lamellibrachia satsuma)]RRS36164.1 MAG: hypothetical protein NV67_08680 [Gammaproteobacteria bacterium (ex Lamellibrachia satsuma)]